MYQSELKKYQRCIQLGVMSCVFLLVSTVSIAQSSYRKERPSYYHGKRWAVDINLGMQLAGQPQRVAKDLDLEPTRIGGKLVGLFVHANPEVTANFALGTAFGVYTKVGYTSRSRVSSTNRISYKPYPSNSSYSVSLYEYGTPKMTGTSIGGGISFYFRDKASLAPMGSQFRLGMSLYNIRVTHKGMFYAKYDSYDTRPENPLLALDPYELQIRHGSVDAEYVLRQPISNTLYYTLGMSTSLNFNSREDKVRSTEPIYQRLEKSARETLILKDLLTFTLGIGVFL